MELTNIRIKDIHCILNYKPQTLRWRTENRRDHIIGIQLSGSCYHDFGYKKFYLSENCVFFFNQKDDYSAKVAEKGEAYSVHFTTYEPVITDSFCKNINSISEVYHLIERIDRLNKLNRQDDNLAISGLYRLCSLVSNCRLQQYGSADDRLVKSKEYIDLHIIEPDCLDSAAGICGITRRRFNDIFRSRYNITPNRYIIECKIENAKKFLRLGNLSISETAELSGFNDIFYFSKVFKTETGITPSEYKKEG